MEELVREVEEVAQKGEQRNVYKVTKFICGKYNAAEMPPYGINKDSSSRLKKTKKHVG